MEIFGAELGWCLKLLLDMVSIPTVNPPGEDFEKFSKYVAEVLKGLGMEVEVVEVPSEITEKVCRECVKYPRYIVLGRAGAGKPVVQFNGHYDVVPPGSGWSFNPFAPQIVGDRLYGRGSVDMKGGIAAVMLAIKSFLSRYRDFRGTLEVALVPDEEIGGESGTGYLVKHISKPDYAIIAEPSSSKAVWIGHKGAVWGLVEVFGKQAHGSTPWRGVNAFEYMAKIALRLVDEYRKVLSNRKSGYDYGDPEGAKPTINIGGEVRGSTKVNIVPGYYAFSFDRRVIPEERLSDVEKEIVELINRISSEYPEVRVSVSITNRLAPALTNPDSPLVKTINNAMKNVLGFEPRLTVCLGGLDLHYYTEQNVEAVAYGPGPEENAHIVDEFVSISEIEAVAKVYLAFLKTMLLPT